MRMHAFLVDDGNDFSGADERFAAFLAAEAAWLPAADAYRARLGLHELLVNIRHHAYADGPGPIEVGATATADGVTVAVTDWGAVMPDVQPEPLPRVSDEGGYGLAIIDLAWHEVTYRRVSGRNVWVLTLHAAALTPIPTLRPKW